ncbi:hypothetical protein MycrhDRAFT_4118 [Mycolicibacterium rhodesiae JS60]|nr:hypothetical protein MycrhDRAFT_4118 [Mycolicibacterium rhodesiae JS60]
MAAPTADDLAAFMGREINADQAGAVLQIVSALAASYTRGVGFTAGEPDSDDIRAVILTAAARRLTDPTQTVTDRTMGPFSTSYQTVDGWTTWELCVLNRYRVRAL